LEILICLKKNVIENGWEYWIYIILLIEVKMKILLIGGAVENGSVVLQKSIGRCSAYVTEFWGVLEGLKLAKKLMWTLCLVANIINSNKESNPIV
jgi:hypothetical protein